eukprot:CAMPEP_0177720090 /NCGR_PEP_ID=MMETSP0484_2-20121128/16446_1 /TAXON_ID=354590 /ORGANISM="Rhodomonas lens, Strain RHODO" /LENGTH=160 /DNA_ID=CAMNT_0019232341 /DNA_START=40 /DNA_END=523 /DNA_ORIENTATION=-
MITTLNPTNLPSAPISSLRFPTATQPHQSHLPPQIPKLSLQRLNSKAPFSSSLPASIPASLASLILSPRTPNWLNEPAQTSSLLNESDIYTACNLLQHLENADTELEALHEELKSTAGRIRHAMPVLTQARIPDAMPGADTDRAHAMLSAHLGICDVRLA